ncbi:hypothetical protein ACFZCK_33625 [Kitasatospora purpeofusca]|uniref:hypothetical protein n=2 Tax=Streptomycetaceae TaxID=2062 RepID=UPI0036EE8F9F
MGLHPVRLHVVLAMEDRMTDCANCHAAPAVIEDIEVEPPRPWCLGCATALVRAGDPVLRYRSLGDGQDEYARVLSRGSTAVVRFG